MHKNMSAIAAVIVAALVLQVPATPAAIDDGELNGQARRAIDHGLKWLREQQQENGSWEHYPGITALVLTAYARSPRAYTEEDGPFVRKAVEYLKGLAKADGGIYDRDLPVYNTATAMQALCSVGNPKLSTVILNAREFLVKQQAGESNGYESSDKFYGGIGYGNDERPDLSNLQLALESLEETGLPDDHVVWSRAVRFLERCQNRSESNDQEWAGNDGGFVYYPGSSMAEGTRSYGSMTYAGLKSFIYSNLEKDDPRIQSATNWIRKHYTVRENPGMGSQGLYYYFHTFAKALRVRGSSSVEDDQGTKHPWAEELVGELLSRQDEVGFWVNSESDRWWEGNKVLATALAILALEEALAEPGPRENPCPSLGRPGS